MTQAKLLYQRKKVVDAIHRNGAEIKMDAPKDVGGEGIYFAPTDLLGVSLASCMLITMGIAAERLGIDLEGTTAEVEKEMTNQPCRRIGKLVVRILCHKVLGKEIEQALEKAALHCPVHASLHPEIRLEIRFIWGISP